MANFSSSPSASFFNSNLWGRLQSILGKPIPYRCREIADLIATNSTKDLSHILKGLLENIFGYGPEPGWALDSITKTHQPSEFDAILRLMEPEGPLMQLVFNLQTDPYLTFEFPFNSLPAPTRHTIEEGNLPMFYVNKIQCQSYSKPAVVLNAFELYMFYFSEALVSPNWQMKPSSWSNLTDIAYPRLLDDYLRFFLPLNKKSLPKFPKSTATGVRTPLVQQTPLSGRHSPTSGSQTRSRSKLGLFKTSLLSPQKQHSQSSPGTEKVEGDLWWTETFIQVIAEFWLNQNALDVDRGISTSSLSGLWRDGSKSLDVFYNQFESYLPSNNHVRLVRLLLKHLHYFVNGAEREIISSPYQTVDVSPLDGFKRSILPSILQKRIYGFLKNSFERWPLDSSFKWVLETWLTYIQPWRYLDVSKRGSSEKDLETVSDIWFPFIRDNFLFYSVLFQEFLQRTKRMHLTSVHNAHIVFRVSKVLNLPNLPYLLRETEKMMYSSLFKQNEDIGSGYLAHELSMVLRFQLSELERQDFSYINLFGKETEKQVIELVDGLHSARLQTESTQQPEKKHNKSGFSSIFDFSSMFETSSHKAGDLTSSEMKNLISLLEKGSTNLCKIFDLSPQLRNSPLTPSTPVRLRSGEISYDSDQSSYMNQSKLMSVPSTPDCQYTSQGPQLTELGRYQLMNGLRKFEISFQGDPDLQPIRSFENATLVRLLYKFTSIVNRQFGTEISSLYNRNDLLGKMSKVYFAPTLLPSKAPCSPMTEERKHSLQTPRLSLRSLASYQTLLYLGLVYVFLVLFMGFGPVGYVLFLFGLVFMYGLFRALVMVEEIDVR